MNRVLLTAVLIFVTGTLACDPIVMIPGGELSGTVTAVPASWDFTADIDTVQVETNPDDPYSVNVWGVGVGSDFYVAGSKESRWTQNLVADSRVKLRIGDALYELNAIGSDTGDDADVFLRAAQAKYDFEAEPDQRETSIVFRLEAR
jgi:hypothetical protein